MISFISRNNTNKKPINAKLYMQEKYYNMVDLICRKRDGGHLSGNEIRWMITDYINGKIPDYQMSALLMAIVLRGMNKEETTFLTKSMIASGDSIDLSDISGIKVDKHSTGGVGDKISLILAPVVAAAGVVVPMMSGRGLGHTGGTLDKLEAIPGFKTDLSISDFKKILKKIGFAMIGQTDKIVPADRKLYSLRDVSGTVPSIPLICSSIISKKKAEGTDALVMDVKVGSGAFMKDREKAATLAHTLVELGSELNIKTAAVLTNMDEPLGYAVGNWLETREAVKVLKGEGPDDILRIVVALGSTMLMLGGKTDNRKEAEEIIRELINSGKGYNKFLQMVDMQGGNSSVFEKPEHYPFIGNKITVKSPDSGYIKSINALKTGILSVELGAGRKKIEDKIDFGAGIEFFKKRGDTVKENEPIAAIYTQKKNSDIFVEHLLDCISFSDSAVTDQELIYKFINC